LTFREDVIKKYQQITEQKCMMISMNQIEDFSIRIAKEFEPHRIILFGSYADGKPTPDSDVDPPVQRQTGI
jgi:predicted nucleotidyltransferase